jgi:hypothetical protein
MQWDCIYIVFVERGEFEIGRSACVDLYCKQLQKVLVASNLGVREKDSQYVGCL